MTVIINTLLVISQIIAASGHGYVNKPIARNALQVQTNNLCSYSDTSKPTCGGNAQSWNIADSTGCGILQGNTGPYVFGSGDLSYEKWGYKTTYTSGQEVTATVMVTAFHGGIFQFRIQDVGSQNDPNGALWKTSQLLQVNSYSPVCGSGCAYVEPGLASKTCAQVPLVAPNIPNVGNYTIRFQLPAGLTCKHCVIQWNWQTANSCPTPGLSCGLGSENFWNCADVEIVAAAKSPSLAPVTSSPSVKPPTKTPSLSTSSPSASPVIKTSAPSVTPVASTPTAPNPNNYFCGTTYAASLSCGKPCPLTTECGTGEMCYANVPCSSSSAPVVSPTSVPIKSTVPTNAWTAVPSKNPVSTPTVAPITSSFKPTTMPALSPTVAPVVKTSAPSVTPVASTPTAPNPNNYFCGTDYWASLSCGKPCPLTTECGTGEMCYANVPCSGPVPSVSPTLRGPSLAPHTGAPSVTPHSLAPNSGAAYVGLWKWTWSGNVAYYPAGTNLAIAFSGYTDVTYAMRDSAPLLVSSMPSVRYLSLGGGNAAGTFTLASLNAITAAINANTITGYTGIAYDIEEGDSGLASAFTTSFAAAKAKGFKVLVTVSHSQPYAISDAAALMQVLLADPNVDIFSPQLYSTGYESVNDYTAVGTPWSAYAATKAAVVPSIVTASYYNDAVTYFAKQGVTLQGYVQWSQT